MHSLSKRIIILLRWILCMNKNFIGNWNKCFKKRSKNNQAYDHFERVRFNLVFSIII